MQSSAITRSALKRTAVDIRKDDGSKKKTRTGDEATTLAPIDEKPATAKAPLPTSPAPTPQEPSSLHCLTSMPAAFFSPPPPPPPKFLHIGTTASDGVGDLEHLYRTVLCISRNKISPERMQCHIILLPSALEHPRTQTLLAHIIDLVPQSHIYLSDHVPFSDDTLRSLQRHFPRTPVMDIGTRSVCVPNTHSDAYLEVSTFCFDRVGWNALPLHRRLTLAELGGYTKTPFLRHRHMGFHQDACGVWTQDIHDLDTTTRETTIDRLRSTIPIIPENALIAVAHNRNPNQTLLSACVLLGSYENPVYCKVPSTHAYGSIELVLQYQDLLKQYGVSNITFRLPKTCIKPVHLLNAIAREQGTVTFDQNHPLHNTLTIAAYEDKESTHTRKRELTIDAGPVSEEEYLSLIQSSHIGHGSGDTSYIKAMSGILPPFLEPGGASQLTRQFIDDFIRYGTSQLLKYGYDKLSEAFASYYRILDALEPSNTAVSMEALKSLLPKVLPAWRHLKSHIIAEKNLKPRLMAEVHRLLG
jgi:hypothetical protein